MALDSLKSFLMRTSVGALLCISEFLDYKVEINFSSIASIWNLCQISLLILLPTISKKCKVSFFSSSMFFSMGLVKKDQNRSFF